MRCNGLHILRFVGIKFQKIDIVALCCDIWRERKTIRHKAKLICRVKKPSEHFYNNDRDSIHKSIHNLVLFTSSQLI